MINLRTLQKYTKIGRSLVFKIKKFGNFYLTKTDNLSVCLDVLNIFLNRSDLLPRDVQNALNIF